LGYPDEKIRELAQKYLDLGYTVFKVKVGRNLEDDIKRCKLLRDIIGYDRTLVSFLVYLKQILWFKLACANINFAF